MRQQTGKPSTRGPCDPVGRSPLPRRLALTCRSYPRDPPVNRPWDHIAQSVRGQVPALRLLRQGFTRTLRGEEEDASDEEGRSEKAFGLDHVRTGCRQPPLVPSHCSACESGARYDQ